MAASYATYGHFDDDHDLFQALAEAFCRCGHGVGVGTEQWGPVGVAGSVCFWWLA